MASHQELGGNLFQGVPTKSAPVDNEDSDWEYEYSQTETQDIYVTLQLPRIIPPQPPKKKHVRRKTKAPKKQDRVVGDEDAQATPQLGSPEGNDETQVADQSQPLPVDDEADAPSPAATAAADPRPTNAASMGPTQMQLLRVGSHNPLLFLNSQVYSCDWVQTVGTDLLLVPKPKNSQIAMKAPSPFMNGDSSAHPSSPEFDVLSASNWRLVATPVRISRRQPNASAPVPHSSQADFHARLKHAKTGQSGDLPMGSGQLHPLSPSNIARPNDIAPVPNLAISESHTSNTMNSHVNGHRANSPVGGSEAETSQLSQPIVASPPATLPLTSRTINTSSTKKNIVSSAQDIEHAPNSDHSGAQVDDSVAKGPQNALAAETAVPPTTPNTANKKSVVSDKLHNSGAVKHSFEALETPYKRHINTNDVTHTLVGAPAFPNFEDWSSSPTVRGDTVATNSPDKPRLASPQDDHLAPPAHDATPFENPYTMRGALKTPARNPVVNTEPARHGAQEPGTTIRGAGLLQSHAVYTTSLAAVDQTNVKNSAKGSSAKDATFPTNMPPPTIPLQAKADTHTSTNKPDETSVVTNAPSRKRSRQSTEHASPTTSAAQSTSSSTESQMSQGENSPTTPRTSGWQRKATEKAIDLSSMTKTPRARSMASSEEAKELHTRGGTIAGIKAVSSENHLRPDETSQVAPRTSGRQRKATEKAVDLSSMRKTPRARSSVSVEKSGSPTTMLPPASPASRKAVGTATTSSSSPTSDNMTTPRTTGRLSPPTKKASKTNNKPEANNASSRSPQASPQLEQDIFSPTNADRHPPSSKPHKPPTPSPAPTSLRRTNLMIEKMNGSLHGTTQPTTSHKPTSKPKAIAQSLPDAASPHTTTKRSNPATKTWQANAPEKAEADLTPASHKPKPKTKTTTQSLLAAFSAPSASATQPSNSTTSTSQANTSDDAEEFAPRVSGRKRKVTEKAAAMASEQPVMKRARKASAG